MPDMPLSIKDVCIEADINPNSGRFVIDDCVSHGLIEKQLLVDKGPKYKRFTYNITDKGNEVLLANLKERAV